MPFCYHQVQQIKDGNTPGLKCVGSYKLVHPDHNRSANSWGMAYTNAFHFQNILSWQSVTCLHASAPGTRFFSIVILMHAATIKVAINNVQWMFYYSILLTALLEYLNLKYTWMVPFYFQQVAQHNNCQWAQPITRYIVWWTIVLATPQSSSRNLVWQL